MADIYRALLCARTYSEHFICIISFHPHDNHKGEVYFYPHIKDEEPEAERGQGYKASKIPGSMTVEPTFELLCDIVFQSHTS